MVGSDKEKRTDKELIRYLREKFGRDWFLCRDSRIHRSRLEKLVDDGLLLKSRQVATYTIHYKVV